MTATVTATEVDHLRAMRERAESAYAQACRALVAQPEDPHLLNMVRWHAQSLHGAQAQYGKALAALGVRVQP
jgi:hypothetical protein